MKSNADVNSKPPQINLLLTSGFWEELWLHIMCFLSAFMSQCGNIHNITMFVLNVEISGAEIIGFQHDPFKLLGFSESYDETVCLRQLSHELQMLKNSIWQIIGSFADNASPPKTFV